MAVAVKTNTKLGNNYLTWNGVKYYRAHNDSITIGYYGEKPQNSITEIAQRSETSNENEERIINAENRNKQTEKAINENALAQNTSSLNTSSLNATSLNALSQSVVNKKELNQNVLSQNALDQNFVANLELNHLKLKSEIVNFHYYEISNHAFEGGVNALIKGETVFLSSAEVRKGIDDEELKVILFSPAIDDLIRITNSSPIALNNLKTLTEPRIVSEILVIADADFAATIKNSRNITLHSTAYSADNELTYTYSGNKSTVAFSLASCFAYMLLKVDWKMEGMDREYIENLNKDPWSPY
jgi:hypothetical protein